MIDRPLDRRADDRADPARIAAHWNDPAARVIEIDLHDRFTSDSVGIPTANRAPRPDDVFLGVGRSGPWFGRRVPEVDGVSLREAHGLSEEEREALTAALAVLAWHDQDPHCERCGHVTEVMDAGFARRCRECGASVFPRTDPAMIVALLDPDDRLLLAHQVSWPVGRASLLAGFVEAGESVEQAVLREVAEESQLTVSALRYLVSQPWPFPRSLMMAYVARAHGVPVVDGVEIAWAQWYTRDGLEEDLAGGGLLLPGPGSVARRVIDTWRARTLPAPEGAGLGWALAPWSGPRTG